ncbi:MAG: FAD:protein FMN transferase [Candidatus Omnitrophica bacterium]|nr:FAD:protein FMN transferase [Candidatus Omnitrophota bacterium]MBU1995897.1 FAD:protein FMN transferase [Candidatus Omnitrophota bacterium]MBU4333759.1 FAD:protein FMN transferase [Candidatus Omnitrophota bacterium]
MKRLIKNKKFRLAFKISLLIGMVLLVLDQNNAFRKRKTLSEARLLMDTIVRFDLCDDGHTKQQTKNAFDEAWNRFKDLENKLNVYDKKSEVSKINDSHPEQVLISNDTYGLIESAIDYHDKTNGAFNICVGPLIRMWKEANKNNMIPSELDYLKIKDAIDIKNISLIEGDRAVLKDEFAKIDLGGIAKGYAVDEAVKIFKQHGFTSFLIDAGGDVYASGFNCVGKPWRIGIRDPFNRSNIIDVVALTDSAVTTSGNYERFYQIDDNKYSHIFDPHNLMPQKNVLSATVIAPTAQEADVFSTALCVLGEDEGLKIIERYDNKHAAFMIISSDKGTLEKRLSKHYKKFR